MAKKGIRETSEALERRVGEVPMAEAPEKPAAPSTPQAGPAKSLLTVQKSPGGYRVWWDEAYFRGTK